jgi:ferredoxin-NADP reductase
MAIGFKMGVTRKLRCVVQKIMDHGSGVYTLELIPEKLLPPFLPGQFLHLALDEYDPSRFWPDSRAFSIASSPKIRDKLRISYAVKGNFSSRMERELVEGKHVWVKLPYGDFVVDKDKPTTLIAGGTGITPFCSFLEDLDPGKTHEVHLFYGARSTSLLIYRELLMRIALSVSQFYPHYFIEVAPDHSESPEDSNLIVGCLAIEKIWPLITNPQEMIFYISGPPPMWKVFLNELQSRKVPVDNIRIDAWE